MFTVSQLEHYTDSFVKELLYDASVTNGVNDTQSS